MGGATVIRTIENDPDSPFGPPEVPAAEWTFRYCFAEGCKRGPDFMRAWLTKTGLRHFPQQFPSAMSLEHVVDAYVSHGRWVWDCPLCNASQVASAEDPRAVCAECFNGGDGYYPVRFPAAREAIEELLGRRTDAARNWSPGESIERLQLENVQHGLDDHLPEYPGHGQAATIARAWLDERAALERERREELAARTNHRTLA